MNPGDVLVVFTSAFKDALDSTGLPVGESGMIEALQKTGPHRTAANWVDAARRLVDHPGASEIEKDLTVLVLRRRAEGED